MSQKEDRPRGILTPSDRDLLRGEIEYENRRQYSNRYKDIRQRIANGLLDFNILRYTLRDRDRKRIFHNPANEASTSSPLFYESIKSLLYWVYLGFKEWDYNFEGLLVEAVEEAEEDFARMYYRDNVEIDVRFDVDVRRSHDIGDLITALENGDPVQANQVYNLLELPNGVPIDLSKLDTVRVWSRSPYPEREQAVLEAVFSKYLDVDVDIEDAIDRITLEDRNRRSAAIDPNQSQPNPSKIKNYRSSTDSVREGIEEIRQQELADQSSTEEENEAEEKGAILDTVIDEMMESAEQPQPTIHDLIDQREEISDRDNPVTPASIEDLLEQVRDPFVSTAEIAAAFDCAPEAARQALSELLEAEQVQQHSVIDTNGSPVTVWWLADK